MNISLLHPLTRQCCIMRVLSGPGAPQTLGELADRLESLSGDEVCEAVQTFCVHVAGGHQ